MNKKKNLHFRPQPKLKVDGRVSLTGSRTSLSISVEFTIYRVKLRMIDSSSILKRKVEDLATRWHCKYDFLQMNHGLKSLKRVQRREAVPTKNKSGYTAVFHSPSIVTGLLHWSGPCTPLCFGIEAVEQKKDILFGRSLLYHCYCLCDTLKSLLVQKRYVSVSCSQQIIASAQDLRSLIDFSRIMTVEKSPIQREKWHLNPELKSFVEHIIRELCPARSRRNQYSSCTPHTTQSRGKSVPWFAIQ